MILYWQLVGYGGRVVRDFDSKEGAEATAEAMNRDLFTDEYRVLERDTSKWPAGWNELSAALHDHFIEGKI